jgi:hypothetical protein
MVLFSIEQLGFLRFGPLRKTRYRLLPGTSGPDLAAATLIWVFGRAISRVCVFESSLEAPRTQLFQ